MDLRRLRDPYPSRSFSRSIMTPPLPKDLLVRFKRVWEKDLRLLRVLLSRMGTGQESALDEFFMRRAVSLAWSAAGKTDPNPMVGAVVARDGVIVAEGCHERAGQAHAEVVALGRAGEDASGGTLYVNLEPCVHYGKTPPCVDRIIESGIRRVVVSTPDPDGRVKRRGIEKLRANGVLVEAGLLSEEAILLNLGYFKRHLLPGTLVTLKAAVSLDARVALEPRRRSRITGARARKDTHKLRATHRGVMVGIGTVLADSPRLDCRLLEGVQVPVPIVLDTHLKFPLSYPWFEEGREFILCTGEGVDGARVREIERKKGEVIRCRERDGKVDLGDALERLFDKGITSVLVEGGAEVFSSFIEKNLWDAIYLFIAPMFFGLQGVELFQRKSGGELGALPVDGATVGQDFLLRYLSKKTMGCLVERLSS